MAQQGAACSAAGWVCSGAAGIFCAAEAFGGCVGDARLCVRECILLPALCTSLQRALHTGHASNWRASSCNKGPRTFCRERKFTDGHFKVVCGPRVVTVVVCVCE